MSSVDKLFRSKLADEQLRPSPQAWEKLEARLSKKNKTVVWLRVAAAVAVACLLSVVWLNLRTNEAPALTKTNPGTENVEQPVPAPAEQPSARTEVADNQKPVEAKQLNASTPAKKVVKESMVAEKQEAVEKPETVVTDAESLLAAAEVPEQKPDATVAQKSVVIVYSLPSIKPKEETVVLSAETVVAQAEAPQTGIQKLWEAAKEVKNIDNPLGDLREAKNELFALDFKKTKNRN